MHSPEDILDRIRTRSADSQAQDTERRLRDQTERQSNEIVRLNRQVANLRKLNSALLGLIETMGIDE